MTPKDFTFLYKICFKQKNHICIKCMTFMTLDEYYKRYLTVRLKCVGIKLDQIIFFCHL